jgi:hypothetical protein
MAMSRTDKVLALTAIAGAAACAAGLAIVKSGFAPDAGRLLALVGFVSLAVSGLCHISVREPSDDDPLLRAMRDAWPGRPSQTTEKIEPTLIELPPAPTSGAMDDATARPDSSAGTPGRTR